MSDENIAPATEPAEKIAPKPVVITDIQRRLAREENVPVEELSGLSKSALCVLNIAGIRTIKELIFFPNKALTRAFGGKGNAGTRGHIRRINAVLCGHGFPRRMSVPQYNERIEELQKIINKE